MSDMYLVMRPIYFARKILGLAPFYIKGSTGNRTFIRISKLSCYKIANYVFVVALIATMASVGTIMTIIICTGIGVHLQLCFNLVSMVTIALIFLLNEMYAADTIRTWQVIQDIDRRMRRMGINVDYPFAGRLCTALIVIACGTALIIVITVWLFIPKGIMALAYMIAYAIQHVYCSFDGYFFMCYLLLVGKKYQQINSFYEAMFAKLWSFELHLERILRKTSRIREDLFEACVMINAFQSKAILLFIGLNFCQLVEEAHRIIGMCFMDEVNLFRYGAYSVGGLHYLLQLAIVIGPCISLIRKKSNFKHILLRIMIRSKHKPIRKEVNASSLEMLHYGKKFSAAGFFDIDGEFVFDMIGGSVTLLVILLQFREAFDFY